MAKKPVFCHACGNGPLCKDEIATSKKYLGNNKYCYKCLCSTLGFDMEELMELIQSHKDEGCELFK